MTAEHRPRSLVRILLGPLLANHALILVGAFFLVAGARRDLPTWTTVGSGLVIAGIGVEGAVLGWAASLARRAAAEAGPAAGKGPAAGSVLATGSARCASCGWTGPNPPLLLCPRCRRPTIRIP